MGVHLTEQIQLAIAIVATSAAKYLMTDEGAEEGETDAQARVRRRKTFGGIIAGMVVAFYGNETVVGFFGLNPDTDKIIVAIVLTMTGEHLTRWLVANAPQILNAIVKAGRKT